MDMLPTLFDQIKAVPAPGTGNRINEFNMNISIKRAQAEDAKGAAKAGGKAGGAK